MTDVVPDTASVGERIEHLLEASAASGPLARERSEELVRLVADLYGGGLERVLELVEDHGGITDELADALADDELVSGLLVVHGLHPYGVGHRVERALEKVRPYLASHGGDVRLLEVSDDAVVRVELLGACDGCASSSVTLELAVEDAVLRAAPEIVRIDVAQPATGRQVISLDELTASLHQGPGARTATGWTPVLVVDEIPVGGLRSASAGGTEVVIARLTSGTFAYADACARCGAGIADALLQRAPALPGSAVLTCRSCGARYDVRRAGASLDEPDLHLEPVPLLERDGVIEIAARAEAAR